MSQPHTQLIIIIIIQHPLLINSSVFAIYGQWSLTNYLRPHGTHVHESNKEDLRYEGAITANFPAEDTLL